MSPIIIIIAAFVGVAALVGGVAIFLRGDKDEKLEDRLSQFTSGKKGDAKSDSILKAGALDVFQAGGGFFEGLAERFGRLSLMFEQADIAIKPQYFIFVCLGLAVASTAALAVAGVNAMFFPLAAVGGGVLPILWLIWRRKSRLKKFGAQLPEALELISRALRAGHSLQAGFQLVGQELPEPIGKEFRRVFEEQNLGIALEESLDALTDRVPNVDLKFFCTAIILQRQTGGDLAEILDKIGRLIRERFQIWGQIQALTGEGRLSGVVLLGLPPVLALVVWKLNPDYISLLFTDELGKKMLLGAVVMQVLGALVIRKIVNIKV
jgi:tight adherence protein B